MPIDIGDVQRLYFDLTDPEGTPVSADLMEITITLPDDTQVGPQAVIPESTGHYHFDYTTTQAGRHVAHWVGTGTNPGANVTVFDVVSAMPPDIISVYDAKVQLKITNDVSDDELRSFIGSATAVVERVRGEAVVKRSFTEKITAVNGRVVLSRLPVVSVTSIASRDGLTTWDVDDTDVDDAGILTSTRTPLAGDLTVIYVAGYIEIPENYLMAARIILEHLWQTKRGNAGVPRPGGMEVATVSGLGFAVPNRALELLGAGIAGIA